MRGVGGLRRAGRSLRARVAIAAWCLLLPLACAGSRSKYPEVRARDGVVSVDLRGIAAKSGRFLTFRAAAGKGVDFFVYRDGAGAPHAVLDACRTCYRWKKGYRLDGAEVVCIKCDMRFPLDGLERGTGSCVPISVASEPRGDALVIPAAALEAGARYF